MTPFPAIIFHRVAHDYTGSPDPNSAYCCYTPTSPDYNSTRCSPAGNPPCKSSASLARNTRSINACYPSNTRFPHIISAALTTIPPKIGSKTPTCYASHPSIDASPSIAIKNTTTIKITSGSILRPINLSPPVFRPTIRPTLAYNDAF